MASNQGKGVRNINEKFIESNKFNDSSFQVLYTYPGNYRAYKAQIAAQYSGASLTIAGQDKFKMNETNKTEEYLRKFPTGKVRY